MYETSKKWIVTSAVSAFRCANCFGSVRALKRFITVLLFALGISMWANAVEVGVLCYYLNSSAKTAKVTGPSTLFRGGKIVIPSSIDYNGTTYIVTSIAPYAFSPSIDSSSGGLTFVDIPNTVTEIGYSAFEDCRNLESVIIPNSVTSIDFRAFDTCTSLASIVIPNSVATIEEETFRRCYGLTSVVIGNSVTSIAARAFESCGLVSVVIPNSVTSIGNFAFLGCGNLKSVLIGNSVTSMGSYVFSECRNLDKCAYPEGLEDPFYSPATRPGNGWYDYYGHKFVYSRSESYIDEKGCLYQGSSLYFVPSDLKGSYQIADSTISIEDYAFYGCTELINVRTPNSVTEIKRYAFRNCENLESIDIPNSFKKINSTAFLDCNMLKEVNYNTKNPIPADEDLLWSLYDQATLYVAIGGLGKARSTVPWKYFANIEEKSFANENSYPAVVKINNLEYTLYENRTAQVNMQYGTLDKVITIPAKIEYNNIEYTIIHVADYALKGHNEVEELRIECESPSIGKSVFSEMQQLRKVFYNIQRPLPDDEYDYSATMFGYSPFVDCNKLKDVEFGPNVKMIMPYMFGTSQLDSINIPDGVEGISHNCFGSSTLKKATLGRDIQTIRFASFGNCQKLETVVYNCRNVLVPNEIWVNGYPPFGDRTPLLKNLYIGSEVETIPDRLFSKVSTLEKIIVYATTPPICASACFNSTKTDKTKLYVPFGTKNLYEQAPIWKNFTNIEELPRETIITYPAVVYVDGLEYTLYGNLKATLNVQTRQLKADIVIPESVKYAGKTFVVDMIAGNALNGHDEVETLTLNCEAPGIGIYAFNGMTNLRKIHYNIKKSHATFNYVNTIWGKHLFRDCDNLEELTFGENVVQVIPYFFSNCAGIESFVIPSTVEELSSDCFTYMCDLKEVTIGEGLKTMGVAQFNGCNKLETLYYNCVDCSVVDNNLTNSYPPFGKDNAALSKLYIGTKVKKIHAKSFFKCSELTDIYVAATTPPECNASINFDANVKKTATLHVPVEYIAAYRSAPVWREFSYIEGYTPIGSGVGDAINQ